MDFVQKINKLREQIQQIKEEIVWLDESPLSKEDFKARVVEWVERMSDHDPSMNSSLTWLRQPKAHVHSSKLLSISANVRVAAGTHPQVAPVQIALAPQLAWLFGEEIKQSLLAKVDAMDYVPGLPLSERPKRRQELLRNLRALEEKEEALICESEEAMVPVFRRVDADPAVVLGYDPESEMTERTRLVYASGAPLPVDPSASAAVRHAIGNSVASFLRS
ncbi:hypothetical protein [Comamonas sp.]